MWHRLRERVAIAKPAPKFGAGPIGLEFAPERMHLMQMESQADGTAIRAALSLRYPSDRDSLLADPAQLRSFVRAALKSRPFRGRRVVTCLPADEVRILPVSYRPEAGKKPDEAILRAVRERLGEQPDALMDYVLIRNPVEDAEQRDALVAVTTRERVTAFLDCLRAAGLEPVAIDIRPVALSRLVTSLQPDEPPYRNVLLANFGANRSYLTVVSGRRLMLDREIEFGETQLAARLSRALALPEAAALKLLRTAGARPAPGGPDIESRVDDEDARRTLSEVLRPVFSVLSQEINKTMVYMAGKTRGDSIERIYLLGSVARYPHAAAWIQGFFEEPVEVLNPFSAFVAHSNAAVLDELDPIAGIAVATGLALWQPGQG